jgi:hypothetical protein
MKDLLTLQFQIKQRKSDMKRFTFIALLAVILFSTNALFAQDNTKAGGTDPQVVTVITPEKFQDFAAENVGKEVEIKGMVIHVCRHGGKKMFIIGEDPDMRVKIDASEKVSVFDPVLEGSTVSVNGIIQPLVEEEIPESEKANQDADHTNYYHKPQFSISCMTFRVVEE